MSIDDGAKVLLSGEYSRRRGYLSQVITSWNGYALIGMLSIWSFCVDWRNLLGDCNSQEMFSIQIAWASALSSVLLGLWRFYARYLDDAIIHMYPAIYICESSLIHEKLRTIKPPKNIRPLSSCIDYKNIGWINVYNRDFGSRGHQVFDFIAGILVVAFGTTSVVVAYKLKIIDISFSGKLHLIGWLIIGNAIGLMAVFSGWLWWRKRKREWPIPKDTPPNKANSADAKSCAAD